MIRDRTKLALQWLKKNLQEIDKIIDVGCADGITARAIAAEGKAVMGMDNDRRFLDSWGKEEGHYFLGNIETAPLKSETFDCVLMLDVYEHVEKNIAAIKEAYRILKKRGVLMFSVPNKGLFSFLDLANINFLFQGGSRGKACPEHPHYSLDDIRLALGNGFSKKKVHRGGLLVYPLLKLITPLLGDKGRYLAGIIDSEYSVDFGPFGYNLMILAEKL